MQCMKFKDHLNKNPFQNFSKNSKILKNPKNFQKPQNLGLNAWNAWIMREKEIIPSDLKQGKVENHGFEGFERKGVYGRWGDEFVEREIKKSEKEIVNNA